MRSSLFSALPWTYKNQSILYLLSTRENKTAADKKNQPQKIIEIRIRAMECDALNALDDDDYDDNNNDDDNVECTVHPMVWYNISIILSE